MRKYIKLFVALAIVFTGCTKDFLDVNTDPDNPTKAPLKMLLTQSQKTMSQRFDLYNGWGASLSFYVQHLVDRNSLWAETGNTVFWGDAYASTLKDVESLIVQAEKEQNWVYAGVGQIMKAYLYAFLVDQFGNVPMSEALKAPELVYPKWDTDVDCYTQIFTLLKQANSNLRKPTVTGVSNVLVPGADDLIYAGSKEKWIRLGNSIKFKLLNQQRLYKDVSVEINALAAADSLIKNNSQDFQLKFGPETTPDNRNGSYKEWESSQKSLFCSPYMLEIMKGAKAGMVYTGCVDPRIRYYMYNQLSGSASGSREGNKIEYRDGGFVSIYPGSIGRYRDGSLDGTTTIIGMYPCGGLYDDNGAKKITGSSSSGTAPYRFLTFADICFIKAELANAGVLTTGTARAYFSAGVDAAFAKVDEVAALVVAGQTAKQTVPVITSLAATNTYKAAVLLRWDDPATDQAKRLEYIMTQKWLYNYGCPQDSYTDWRRTGYPILFDPKDNTMAPGGFVPTPMGDGGGNGGPIPVTRQNASMKSWPWPLEDLGSNPNAPEQKDPYNDKVFWDVRTYPY